MLRIVSHLKKLLLVNDCVIVPRFGGFVLHDVPASYDKEKHFFRPMCRDIVFNTTLRYNDGLLVESYMKMYDVAYQKAYRLIEDDVDDIKTLLYKNREVSLDTIGLFRLGNEGQVIFQPVDSGFQSIESYGLASFRLQTLQLLEKEESVLSADGKKAINERMFYIPVSRKLVRGIIGIAAAVVLFLIVSTPVKQMDVNTYAANFIPFARETEMPMEKATPPAVRKSTERFKDKQLYYVIVSSLNSEKQADLFISRMDKSQFNRVDKLVEARKVRVYADKFDNREQADAYMAKLRKNPTYKDAWVYIP